MSLPDGVEIRPFDPETATDAEFAALHALDVSLHDEAHPGDPADSFDAFVAEQRRESAGRLPPRVPSVAFALPLYHVE